jgi:hypothetical protein
MEALKATKAREITKESVTEAETLVVNGVSVSKPLTNPMQEGDFYFRPDAHPTHHHFTQGGGKVCFLISTATIFEALRATEKLRSPANRVSATLNCSHAPGEE